jgi:predicted metallo-beta-lactamase superfamily hydrolase
LLEGVAYLESLSSDVGRRVHCAANFMGHPRRLLEAQRRELCAAMPVRAGWP